MPRIAVFFSDVIENPDAFGSKARAEAAIGKYLDADGSPGGAAIRLRWIAADTWEVVSVKPLIRETAVRDAPDPREKEAKQRVAHALRRDGFTVRE